MSFLEKIQASGDFPAKVRPWNGYIDRRFYKFKLQIDIGEGLPLTQIIEISKELKTASNIFSAVPGLEFEDLEVVHSRMGILAVSMVANVPKKEDHQIIPVITKKQTLEQYAETLKNAVSETISQKKLLFP